MPPTAAENPALPRPPWSRRGHALRARPALLWGLVGFLGLQLGLAVGMECGLAELRDPFYAYKAARLRQRLTGPERPFSVVLLGSSRTAYGFQAGIVEEQLRRELHTPVVVFNFGTPGAGPVTQLLYLRRLLAEGVRPDLLLIEVLPALLDGKGSAPREAQWLPPDRLWYDEFPVLESYGFAVRELRRDWWEGRLLPWYTHRFAIVSRVRPAWLPYQLRQDWGRGDDPSGWSPRPVKPPTPQQRERSVSKAREEYGPTLEQLRLGGPAAEAVSELLELCRQNGIAAGLVLMPEGPEFRSWYPAAARQQLHAFLERMQAEYGCPVLDAREWVAEEDFSDSHHLLSRGAALFSERLGREALLPLLKTTPPRGLPTSPATRRPTAARSEPS